MNNPQLHVLTYMYITKWWWEKEIGYLYKSLYKIIGYFVLFYKIIGYLYKIVKTTLESKKSGSQNEWDSQGVDNVCLFTYILVIQM